MSCTQSDQIQDISAALCKFQFAARKAHKNGLNPHFGSKFADLESIFDAVRDALHCNGLSVTQTFNATDGGSVEIVTTLRHVSGQFISGCLSIPLQKRDAQAVGSAITYGRRYSLTSMLGIVDSDDDGNAGSAPIEYDAAALRATFEGLVAQDFPEGKTVWDFASLLLKKPIQSIDDMTPPEIDAINQRLEKRKQESK